MLVIQTKGKVIQGQFRPFTFLRLFYFMKMNITVNNNAQFVKDPSSIDSLVKQLNVEVRGIAIAVNQTVVSKSEWSKTQLRENDNITIIKATQGG